MTPHRQLAAPLADFPVFGTPLAFRPLFGTPLADPPVFGARFTPLRGKSRRFDTPVGVTLVVGCKRRMRMGAECECVRFGSETYQTL